MYCAKSVNNVHRRTSVYLWRTWKHSNGDMKERSSVLLENVEVPFAHYLVENKIRQDPTHVLYSA
jgi:hypothetical protein